jgi:acetyl esterase/lipase
MTSYARRQLALAALAANAIRPSRGKYGAIPSFALGWPTSELAPQLLALSLADTALTLGLRRRGDLRDLVIGAGTAAAYGYLVKGARESAAQAEEALNESLGEEYAGLEAISPATLGQLARPFRLHQPDVEVLRNIAYAEGGRRAKLDIYRPRGVDLSDAPVLVQIHGGGWTIGTKEEQGLILMNLLASRGWVCVSVNYRLAPKYPWPTQIVDVKRALGWVHEHIAEYGGDPSYVAITGGSAGGHLSALAALTPGLAEYQPGFTDSDTSVVAAVPFYGVYDMAGLTGDRHSIGMRDDFLGPRVFKKDPAEHLDAFVQASPLTHVHSQAPDFFVIHGRNDTLVPASQARIFVETMREKSDATVTYLELPGTQHAFEIFSSIRSQHVIRAVTRWLEWHHARWLATQAMVPSPAR